MWFLIAALACGLALAAPEGARAADPTGGASTGRNHFGLYHYGGRYSRYEIKRMPRWHYAHAYAHSTCRTVITVRKGFAERFEHCY